MLELLSKYFPSSVVSHLNSIEDKRDNNKKKKKEMWKQSSNTAKYYFIYLQGTAAPRDHVPTTADKFEFKKTKQKK